MNEPGPGFYCVIRFECVTGKSQGAVTPTQTGTSL